MNMTVIARSDPPKSTRSCEEVVPQSPEDAAFAELEASVGLALETYSNVHRGAGYNSMASTLLYERARNTVLDVCGLDRGRYYGRLLHSGPRRRHRSRRAPRPVRRSYRAVTSGFPWASGP